jgi:outer membrane protein OmpA-like peptidoglycan-associated protein/tetratricopeptide (TPR) repeat protein
MLNSYAPFRFKKAGIRFLFLFSITFVLSGCFKKIISIKQGDKHYVKGNYYAAKEQYEKAVRLDTTSYTANLKLGLLLNEELNQIDESLPYLQRAVRYRKGSDTIPDILKAFGDYCFYGSGYKQAGSFYKGINDVIIDNSLKYDVYNRLNNITYALGNPDKNKKSIAGIINLGYTVNSYYAEYNSVFDISERRLYYTARRPENIGQACDKWDGKYFEDMYTSNHMYKFGFTPPENFTNHASELANVKNTKKHESIVSISNNDSILFSYKNNAVYVSKLKDGVWSEPEKMNKKINRGRYQNHISIAPDNKTIFFSSNKRNGEGGLDLFMVKLTKDSTWSDPINLGPKINTGKDEESVEIQADGKTIIFSSKGLPGYGGYDIFSTTMIGDNEFSDPINLGPQINSPSDDIYLKLDSTMTEGFLSSSRRGGYGDLDIYRFYFLNKPNFNKCICDDSILNNKINTAMNLSMVKINDSVKIDLSAFKEIYGHPTLYTFWKIDNKVINVDTSAISFAFDKKGHHNLDVQFVSKCDTCYDRLVYCYGKNIIAYDKDISDTIDYAKEPDDKVISLDPVYFYFDKDFLRSDAIKTLKEDIKVLQENPYTYIKIIANCDSRGPREYNVDLAQRRAASVIKYLKKNNIASDRILEIIPLGEDKPINNCKDGVICPESEHQKNRRVDLIIAETKVKG